MIKLLLTISLLWTNTLNVYCQETGNSPKLKSLIDSLYQVDQQVQQDFLNAFQRGVSADSIKFYEKREFKTFEGHIPLIRAIVSRYGYPNFEKVGKESSDHYFVMVQHSDYDVRFQKMMLPLIKRQVEKKEVIGSNFAYLYDRIQINSGKPQLYGTQLEYDVQGNALSKNLRDRQNVNKRRAEYGMDTLEAYLARNTEIHKMMNKKN